MALINCPKCDKKISDTAEKCIGCGNSLKLKKTTTKKMKKESTPKLKEVQNNDNNLKSKKEAIDNDEPKTTRILINILLLIFILASVIILIILMIDELPYISTSRVRGIDRLSEKISIWRTQVYACAYVLITALASLIYFNKR